MKDLAALDNTSNEAFKLLKQLNVHLEQEYKYQPKEKGLILIESTAEVRGRGRGVFVIGVQVASLQLSDIPFW